MKNILSTLAPSVWQGLYSCTLFSWPFAFSQFLYVLSLHLACIYACSACPSPLFRKLKFEDLSFRRTPKGEEKESGRREKQQESRKKEELPSDFVVELSDQTKPY